MRAIITGSNRGIGLAICEELVAKGWNVIAICRKKSKELQDLPVQIEEGVDTRDITGLQRVRRKIKGKVDLLINVAGIGHDDSFEHPRYEEFLEQFEVNVLGTLKATRTFLPLLKKGSKIVIISSTAGSIGRRKRLRASGNLYGYRVSKCAVNMLGVLLSEDLRKKGIPVLLMHPGIVKTRMTNFRGDVTPQESAKGLLKVIGKSSMKKTGSYQTFQGKTLPW